MGRSCITQQLNYLNMLRNLKGQFTAKAKESISNHKKLVAITLILLVIGVCNSVNYTVQLADTHNPFTKYVLAVKNVYASDSTQSYIAPVSNNSADDLYTKIDQFTEDRTQLMMQDPQNLKEYHDAIYTKVTRGINILTTTLK